jgi:hypothetical protein
MNDVREQSCLGSPPLGTVRAEYFEQKSRLHTSRGVTRAARLHSPRKSAPEAAHPVLPAVLARRQWAACLRWRWADMPQGECWAASGGLDIVAGGARVNNRLIQQRPGGQGAAFRRD